MPGGKPEASPTGSPPPELASDSGSVLKPVQNKIRNLRKAIDRATPLEAAAARGEELNPDQQECVRSKAIKVATLADLEEILKKQTSIVGLSEESGGNTTSKRAAKRKEKEEKARAAAAAAAVTASPSEVGKSSAQASHQDESVAGQTKSQNPTEVDKAVSTGGGSDNLPSPKESSPASSDKAQVAAEKVPSPDAIAAAAEASESAGVSKVLDLLHVTDFLQTQDGKSSLLEYFARSSSAGGASLTALDMDILLYFATMLTTPNGNVAHPRAVDTSTAHCIAYLRRSDAEAFQGTTYGRLSAIVEAISSCPLLALRGEPVPRTQVPFSSTALVAEDSAISSIGPVSENDRNPEHGQVHNGVGVGIGVGQGNNATRGRRGGGKGRGRGTGARKASS